MLRGGVQSPVNGMLVLQGLYGSEQSRVQGARDVASSVLAMCNPNRH